MRRHFANYLAEEMRVNDSIFFLTADLGYGLFDNLIKEFPSRAINIGSSEQLMISMSTGLALSGKIPVVYSISPFLIFRPLEGIRNYLQHEKIPVKLVGSGRNRDYIHDGFSHWTDYEKEILHALPDILLFYPMISETNNYSETFNSFIYNRCPSYLNLQR